jgi:hypothetical protein
LKEKWIHSESYNETSSTSKEVSNKAFSTLAPPHAQHNATPSPSPSNAQYDASPSPFPKIVRKKKEEGNEKRPRASNSIVVLSPFHINIQHRQLKHTRL